MPNTTIHRVVYYAYEVDLGTHEKSSEFGICQVTNVKQIDLEQIRSN